MKNTILSICFLLTSLGTSLAQEGSFSVQVNPQEVLMGNYFEVKFILKNAQGDSFSPPDFRDFNLMAGPNHSSSFSMVNGNVDQSLSYSFYLEPTATGNFFIEAASIIVDGKVLETTPVEIVVLPNPDGIQREIPQENHGLQFDSFFDFPFDKEQEQIAKPKKKRKVYKL